MTTESLRLLVAHHEEQGRFFEQSAATSSQRALAEKYRKQAARHITWAAELRELLEALSIAATTPTKIQMS